MGGAAFSVCKTMGANSDFDFKVMIAGRIRLDLIRVE